VVIQITDDEKFLHKHLTLEQCDQYTIDNVKDIVALGFDPARTLIFQNTRYIRRLYPTVLAIQRLVTNNQVSPILCLVSRGLVGTLQTLHTCVYIP